MSDKPRKVKPAAQIVGLLELEVRDKEGNLIKRHEQPMRSFTANFLRYLSNLLSTILTADGQYCSHLKGTTLIQVDFPIQVYDLTNTVTTLSVALAGAQGETVRIGLMSVSAGAGDDTFGLVVGKGTTPPSPDDYNLESKYSNGSGIDQLVYGETTVEQPGISDNTVTFRVVRTFSNGYSSAQSVSEIGLIAKHTFATHAGCGNLDQEATFLIARDVLDAPISVPAGSTLTVRYVISVTT